MHCGAGCPELRLRPKTQSKQAITEIRSFPCVLPLPARCQVPDTVDDVQEVPLGGDDDAGASSAAEKEEKRKRARNPKHLP